MKTPAYETSPGALESLLTTRQFQWAGLYKITLIGGGASYYYSSCDTSILFNGNTYLSPSRSGALFERRGERGKVSLKTGLEVNTLQFTVLPNGATIQGVPFLEAVKQGAFDGADVTFSHAYWAQSNYSSLILPVGVVTQFRGSVAPVQAGRSKAQFTINSYTDRLNQNLPRNIYQAGCINTLFDGGCTLNPASFAVSGSAAAGSIANFIGATLSQNTGYFDLGKITFTSGANNGLSRGIKQYIKGSPSTFSLMSPFPVAPATGDTFTIYPGCDKMRATCQGKFANLANFRGFPYIPENTTGV